MDIITIIPGMEGADYIEGTNNNNINIAYKSKGIDVRAYGAVGDGVADDTNAITSAIYAALEIGANVYIPAGDYYISAHINISTLGRSVRIIGELGTRLFSSTADKTIKFEGTPSARLALNGNLTAGQKAITVTGDLSSYAAGDMLQVESSDNYANVGVSFHKRGEFVTVLSVVGQVVNLTHPIYDNYNAATTTIRNLNAGAVIVESVNFNMVTLRFYYQKCIRVVDCVFGVKLTPPVLFDYSQNIVASGNTCELLVANFTDNTYGIGTGSCQNTVIYNNKVNNFPQGIVAGGLMPTRDYRVLHNTVKGVGYQLDTHTNCEYVRFEGNLLIGGTLYAKGSFVDIVSNECVCLDGDPAARWFGIIRLREDLTDDENHILTPTIYENIVNNKIHSINKDISGGYIGISIQLATFRDTIDTLIISGNQVDIHGYALAFTCDYSADNVFDYVKITNNYFKSHALNTYNTVHFSHTNAHINHLLFENNIVESVGHHPFYLAAHGTVDYVTIKGNHFKNGNIYTVGAGIKNAVIQDNIFDSCTIISYSGGSKHYIKNNFFQNFAANKRCIIFTLTGGDDPISIYLKDNIYQSERVDVIESQYPSITLRDEQCFYSGAITDDNITATEINNIVGGSASTMLRGYKAIINDINGTALTYECTSDGTNWTYNKKEIAQ